MSAPAKIPRGSGMGSDNHHVIERAAADCAGRIVIGRERGRMEEAQDDPRRIGREEQAEVSPAMRRIRVAV